MPIKSSEAKPEPAFSVTDTALIADAVPRVNAEGGNAATLIAEDRVAVCVKQMRFRTPGHTQMAKH